MSGNDVLLLALLLAGTAGLGMLVRLLPMCRTASLGVDNWYWLLCSENVRKSRRLPAVLPQYMLEVAEQWYPPLYSGFLALLPARLLEKHGGKLSQFLDVLHGTLIAGTVWAVTGNEFAALIAGVSYAVAFLPLYYNMQLQPRGLANLLLSITMLGLWHYLQTGTPLIWALILTLSIALLLLHKMTTQMWIVYLLGFSFWSRDWTVAALLPASVLVAVAVSGGFYIKVMRHHWDIVSFWHRNMHLLGSHQYYESPLYVRPGFTSTAFHPSGPHGWSVKARALFKHNAFLLLLLPLALIAQVYGPNRIGAANPNAVDFLWMWLWLTCLWTFLTTFVPFFTALGAGVYYLYQSFLPLFVLVSIGVGAMNLRQQVVVFGLWTTLLMLSTLWYLRYANSISSSGAAVGEDLRCVLDHLRELPGDGVFCIPFTLPDLVAYWTRKRVFWGGHGYGFNSILQPYFPVMRESVAETLRDKPLSYVLFQRDYLDSLTDIGLEQGRDIRLIMSKGNYELYEVLKQGA
jgi:hypothetical protein